MSGGIILTLVYCIPILVGMAVKTQGIIVPEDSHPLKVFLDMIGLTPWVIGFVFAGFISAIFSTADELLNCSSLSLLFDTFQIPRDGHQRTEDEENRLVNSGKFYTVFFGFAAAMIAVGALRFERQISELAIAIFSSQVVFTLPLVFAIFAPKAAPKFSGTAKYSMLLAFSVVIILVVTGWITKDRTLADIAPVIGFFISIVFFGFSIIAHWVKKKAGT